MTRPVGEAGLRALIVDDEPLARRKLRRLLDGLAGIECLGEAANGPQAVEMIKREKPDVVFLDIEMPGLSGLQVVERLSEPTHIVFTTAYDEHAVAAFEVHAADYLLKPFGAARLQSAVDRVRSLRGAGPARGLARLFVRERGRVLPLTASSIVRLEADGDYVRVHAAGRVHLVTATLQELHDRLDPDVFKRIHRSHVVNLDHVQVFEPAGGGRLRARLTDGSQVVASRTRSRELRHRVT